MKTEKKYIRKVVYSLESNNEYKFKDLKDLNLKDDDFIHMGYQEPEMFSEHSHDGYYFIEVHRVELENDEDYEKRIKMQNEMVSRNRKAMIEHYLKYREQFKDTKIGARLVSASNQEHTCSECGEDVENHTHECPKCGTLFSETKNV